MSLVRILVEILSFSQTDAAKLVLLSELLPRLLFSSNTYFKFNFSRQTFFSPKQTNSLLKSQLLSPLYAHKNESCHITLWTVKQVIIKFKVVCSTHLQIDVRRVRHDCRDYESSFACRHVDVLTIDISFVVIQFDADSHSFLRTHCLDLLEQRK